MYINKNNNYFVILLIILFMLYLNHNDNKILVYGREFRLTTFLNPYCQGHPSITISSTTCSPDNYFQVLNDSVISINIKSKKSDCNTQFLNSHSYDTFPIDQCIRVDKDDKNSYSIIMTSGNETYPRSVEGYCNQFNFFDCDNFNIVSFKNGSCFIDDDEFHLKQTCDEDFIYSYKCTQNNCLDSNCQLFKKEPNNVDNDCFKKSIKINELNNKNNNSINNNSANDDIDSNNNNTSTDTLDNSSINHNINNKFNGSSQNFNQDTENRKQMDHQTFERFNNSSKLNSSQLLIIISILLNITLIIIII